MACLCCPSAVWDTTVISNLWDRFLFCLAVTPKTRPAKCRGVLCAPPNCGEGVSPVLREGECCPGCPGKQKENLRWHLLLSIPLCFEVEGARLFINLRCVALAVQMSFYSLNHDNLVRAPFTVHACDTGTWSSFNMSCGFSSTFS